MTDIDLKEQIFALIAINVGFHMLYWFFSNLSKDSARINNSFNKIMGTGMLKIFAVFGMVGLINNKTAGTFKINEV